MPLSLGPVSLHETLPLVLAGPILRRTESTRVLVWLATSRSVVVEGTVLRPDQDTTVGGGRAESIRLGDRLFVHLVEMTAGETGFPTDEVLAYDLTIEGDGIAPTTLGSLGLGRIAYGRHSLPTFFIRSKITTLNVLHGSCRALHGGGEDALVAADDKLEATVGDLESRPSALFLTGDQIYADDVAAPMLAHIRRLATVLMGEGDADSIPGAPRLSGIGLNQRDVIARDAGFSSDKAKNHLMSFGEFAAMYAVAWNEAAWPAMFDPPRAALGHAGVSRAVRSYRRDAKRLERARAALPAVRRVLANTPTYMGFDDHDVTDDWNLSSSWRKRVWDSTIGRRMVANALAGFWAFQGWGNNPDAYTEDFKSSATRWLQGAAPASGADFDAQMWSFDRWSFNAPLQPTTVVLDTRTQRSYDSPEGAARLLGPDEISRVARLARAGGHEPNAPLLIVSAVPVFGFELQERRQRYLVDRLGPYEIDFEAWHSNFAGLLDFMHLMEELRPSFCILLSGDVHYGVTAQASFSIEGRKLSFAQLVSSGQKHAGVVASASLGMLGRLLRARHERVGWNSPPECSRSPRFADHLLRRAVNTDEWDSSSPVFLAPVDARWVGVQTPEDFRECRVYARPTPGTSFLIGENNVGLMSLRGSRVVHRLLIRHRGHTRERSATMDATESV
jgi:hypothetical protein